MAERHEDARFDHFRVVSSGSSQSLTLQDGAFSGSVRPRTALGASTGACSVPTPHARIAELRYTAPARAQVTTSQGSFGVNIEASVITAANGAFDDATNRIEGTITVDGQTHDLAQLPDGTHLDPDYDPTTFDDSWTCDDDVEGEPSFSCDGFAGTLAGGAARLTVNAFGQVASALEADSACGFSSEAVMAGVVVDGELGRGGGAAVYTVEDCVLSFSEPTVVGEDCQGNQTLLTGRVKVSGTKTLSGIVSGDPGEPIVPVEWEPVTLALTLEPLGLHIAATDMDESVELVGGTLAGRLKPRTAIDSTTGACSLATPVASFEELAWSEGRLRIHRGENIVDVRADSSALIAVNGNRGDVENHLAGSITIGGLAVEVPAAGDAPGLSPYYDAADFVASFACEENMVLPETSEACDMSKVLVEGTARLIMQAVGEVASMANTDNDCGFDTTGVLTSPTDVQGDPGEQGSMAWGIEGCVLASNPTEPVKEDCNGKSTFRTGEFTFDGRRRVTGEREEIGFLGIPIADSIVPNSRDAVTVYLDAVSFNDFGNWNLNADGSSADLGVLTIHSGTLSGVVRPVLGENAGEQGTFDVATPVSALDDIVLSDAEVTLVSQGKTFKLDIESTQISAFNGSYAGQSNEIAGTVTMGGETHTLAADPLNPDFEQASFDAAYVCTEDLEATVPSAGQGL
jgi:hypothetical protein